jgi:WD40 repeat protein
MAGGAYQVRESEDESWEEEESCSREAAGGRVRLSLFTWEGLAGVVVVAALCVLFAGDDVPVENGTISMNGHDGLVETVGFSPDGETLVSSSWDKSIRLWDAGGSPATLGRELACLPTEAETYAATVSPDGGTVASAGLGGLTLWNWRDLESFPKVKVQFGPSRSLAFSPDGQTLAIGGFDHKIRLWEPKTDQVRSVLSGHRDVVRSLVFVPDGSMIISLSFDGALKFWDVRTDREIDRLEGLGQGIHAFRLSPDGSLIALSRLGRRERQIEIWDLAANRIKSTCEGHDADVHTLVFSPDGRTLASAGGDQSIRFWNVETGRAAGMLDGNIGWVRSLDFSRDGRWIAYSGSFSRVYLQRIALPNEPSIARKES